MSTNQPNVLVRFFRFSWDALNFSRRLLINLFFLILIIMLVTVVISDDEEIPVADNSALVLNFSGRVVEQKTYVDPAEQFLNEQVNGRQEDPEILLSNVLLVLDKATNDPRISVIVLDLKGLAGGGLNKLQTIGEGLKQFKAAGKKIIAIGDYYSQNQYYLASFADEISLNPMGAVFIEGYGFYNMYYKEALEKLKVTQHVFKVGQYKSAVEPYTRNDMSEPAKQANREWMQALWNEYKVHVAERRQMDPTNFDESLDGYLTKLKQANGDFAQYALDNQWVDTLKNREQIRRQLIDMVGNDGHSSFNQVDYYDYLHLVKPRFNLDNPLTDKIGVVVARGTIVDGHRKAGKIGGDSTAKLLRKARLDDRVKAVVLRVDSPGGSAFASEVIRKEITALQEAGKPVIASMSSVAASGGYWISTSADEIWASPTTITGSIGIYGMFMTFENSLKSLGISTDGVATTELAGFSLARPLDPKVGDIIQMNIERGYQRFINLVSQSRGLTESQVQEIAQGRVWIGKKAHELGLVDELGTLDDAIKSAANMASLGVYDIKLIEQEMSATDKFYHDLLNSNTENHQNDRVSGANTSIQGWLKLLEQQFNRLGDFNDPQHSYVHCDNCIVP